jgi:hypothetical protein
VPERIMTPWPVVTAPNQVFNELSTKCSPQMVRMRRELGNSSDMEIASR